LRTWFVIQISEQKEVWILYNDPGFPVFTLFRLK